MNLHDFVRDASLYQSVLDVGCGTGRWTQHLTAPRVVGVDGHAPTLVEAAQRCPDITLICYDMRKLGMIFLANSFDCVIAMDVVEHVERGEALALLKLFEELARFRVMLFVPTGNHPQTGDATNLGNEELQQHRSTWYPDDFRELGYTVTELPNFHSGAGGKDKSAVIAVKNVRD